LALFRFFFIIFFLQKIFRAIDLPHNIWQRSFTREDSLPTLRVKNFSREIFHPQNFTKKFQIKIEIFPDCGFAANFGSQNLLDSGSPARSHRLVRFSGAKSAALGHSFLTS
jgi:hypothetical protein